MTTTSNGDTVYRVAYKLNDGGRTAFGASATFAAARQKMNQFTREFPKFSPWIEHWNGKKWVKVQP